MPRVSVVMSVFNGEAFLREALESIFRQSFADFEFIIIDDGSTDHSAAIIHDYPDRRIILVRQENQGIAAALNRGIELAAGEYIARQDADDISLPERFSTQVQFLDTHPEVALVGTGALLIDSYARPFSKFSPFTRHERLVAELLRGVCPLMHGSVMARREAILNAGAYKPVFGKVQDVELWLRMSLRYRLANLRDLLYQYRKHDHATTQQAHIDLTIKAFAQAGKLSTNTNAEEWVQFVEEFERNFAGSRWERAFAAENLLREAQIAFAQGGAWRAMRRTVEAMQLCPGLTIELPGRVMRRFWRTWLPMVS
jgi:hypothetical protein